MTINEARSAKGEYGEQVVRKLLTKWGYTVYEPQRDKPERCDIIAMRPTHDLVMVEVKTKEATIKYNSTGFAVKYYNRYSEILANPKNPEFRVVFVDANEGAIYGATFKHMVGKEKIFNDICFWDREIFSQYTKLMPRDIKAILKFQTT